MKRTKKRRVKKARAVVRAAVKLKAKRAVRRNPAGQSVEGEVRQAVERFTGFRGFAPAGVSRVNAPAVPRVLLTIGECTGIMYRTNRGGQVDQYLHRFQKSSRPTLCCSSDGKTLYLLGGAYRVTDRGIEDAR